MHNKTLSDFTDILSSASPTPGGGGATALVGSLAASLSEMVTNLTTGKKKYAEYEQEIQAIMFEAEKLRMQLLECINKDAQAFEPLSKAYAKSKDDPDYEGTMDACLKMAAEPPFVVLKLTCQVIKLDQRLAEIGSKLAISDAATSAMFAYGALYSAAINVKVNTRLMKDREYAEGMNKQVDILTERYAPIAKDAYDTVLKRLTNG